jgi:hypothetical protein
MLHDGRLAKKENTIQEAGHRMESRLKRRMPERKQATGSRTGRGGE